MKIKKLGSVQEMKIISLLSITVLHNENLDKFESGNVVLELNNIKTSEMKGSMSFLKFFKDSYDQKKEVEIIN